MTQIVTRHTRLNAPPDAVLAAVTSPRVLCHIAAPLIRFAPVDPPDWPARFAPGPHVVAMYGIGWVPLGRQVIDISYPEATPEKDALVARDNGHSAMIRRWDHWIIIRPDGAGGSHYTDRVEIEAGWRTGAVALFARLFFAHRQSRLRALLHNGPRAARP
ncbi:hypothetical protein roselon_03092 [Roseibacterium elongatum DSM 19469]|uniref:Cell division inhibitor n=1 Tax=Roseicyclus elongatus DSM 19469 TaxID=1294273 RepID=W8RVQ0_9RHOB|nr:hypothetical protein [Roseibacterium elongatum]AHM05363.1 hypothetical protein roselon_03092 [Roseibacterium elongatum DSM 19469]